MYRLGIDIGSTTIKMALVEVQGDDVQSTKEFRKLGDILKEGPSHKHLKEEMGKE